MNRSRGAAAAPARSDVEQQRNFELLLKQLLIWVTRWASSAARGGIRGPTSAARAVRARPSQ